MAKNAEIRHLREEITRLKLRLAELDAKVEPTSVVCGHDVILEHLKKLTIQHELEGLAQLACYDLKQGWYTTSIDPSKIGTFLEDGNTVREFLTLFCHHGVWEALESAYHGKLTTTEQGVIKLLEEKDLLSSRKLTSKGFICYVVLGHLAFNLTKKVDVRKAIEISNVVYDTTNRHYGEHLPFSEGEFIELVMEHPEYQNLVDHKVSTDDLREYLRQNNVSCSQS